MSEKKNSWLLPQEMHLPSACVHACAVAQSCLTLCDPICTHYSNYLVVTYLFVSPPCPLQIHPSEYLFLEHKNHTGLKFLKNSLPFIYPIYLPYWQGSFPSISPSIFAPIMLNFLWFPLKGKSFLLISVHGILSPTSETTQTHNSFWDVFMNSSMKLSSLPYRFFHWTLQVEIYYSSHYDELYDYSSHFVFKLHVSS